MRAPSLAAASSLVVVLLGLACGSGPGDASYGNAFEVLERTPAQGDTNARVNVPLTARFSRPLDPATVVDGNVLVSGNNGVILAKTLSLSSDRTTLTVTLLAPPALPATLKVVLTSGLKDLTGESFPQADWTFSMPEWYAPFGETPATDSAGAFALDGQGRPVIAWAAADGVQVSRWEAGAGWTSLAGPLHVAGAGALPSLAVDPSGAPVLAWEEATGDTTQPDRQMFVARFDGSAWRDLSGGTLEAGDAVFTAAAEFSKLQPHIAIDAQGNVTLANAVENVARAWRWPHGGTAWIPFTGTLSSRRIQDTVLSEDGTVLALLEEAIITPPRAGGGSSTFIGGGAYALRWNGSTWTPMAGGNSLETAGRAVWNVAVTSGTSPAVAFVDRNVSGDGTTTLTVKSVSDSYQGSLGGNLLPDGSMTLSSVSVTAGPAGAIWLADTTSTGLEVKHWDGRAWSSASAVVDFTASSPILRLDSDGVPVIAFQDMRGVQRGAGKVALRKRNQP